MQPLRTNKVEFLKSAAGTYEPSFFIIQIDSDLPVDTVLDSNESTFTHEYIHFLQDLILPYCMRENLVRLHAFSVQIQRARADGEIHLPYDTSDEDAELTTRQSEFTWGGNTIQTDVGAITSIEPFEEWVEEHQFFLKKYQLTFENFSNYHFGARDLLEYIAFKIESRHFPEEQPLPDLPYRAVDLVLNHFELSYLSDTKRIALAEYCLLNDNPAQRLMVVIEDIKRGHLSGIELQDDESFMRHLEVRPWIAAGRPFETVQEKLGRRYLELTTSMLYKFPDQAFPAVYSWLGHTMGYAQSELAGRSIFASLYALETTEFRREMSSIVGNIGIPLLVNRNGDIGTSLGEEDSKDQFIQLLLAYEFSEYLTRADMQCPMCNVCEKHQPGLMNSNCLDAPFRRAHDDELCPFGAFAKTHGISDVMWYRNQQLVPSRGSDFDRDW
jgi:hypothetical protein